jgi:hypothetical protein
VHRLTADLALGMLDADARAETRLTARRLLAEVAPPEVEDPSTWPVWQRILPHVMLLGPDADRHPEFRRVSCMAAECLVHRGDYHLALEILDTLGAGWSRTLGADDRDMIWLDNVRATALSYAGRPAEAKVVNRRALGRATRLYGENSELALTLAGNLALDHHLLKEDAAAVELERVTYERRVAVLGPDHLDTLLSEGNLGIYLTDAGHIEEGSRTTVRSVRNRTRVLGPEHPLTLISRCRVAVNTLARGAGDSVRDEVEDILDARRRVLGEDHPDTLYTMIVLARVLRLQGDPVGAVELDRQALERYQRVLGVDHEDTLDAEAELRESLDQSGAPPP